MGVSAGRFRRRAGGATPVFCRKVGAITLIPGPSPIEGEGSPLPASPPSANGEESAPYFHIWKCLDSFSPWRW